MFHFSKFNGDISNWNVSNVESMRGMFEHSKFNRDISNWDVSVCCDMSWMFYECYIKKEYKPINVIEYGKGGLGEY
jgi:surface protein